MIVDKRVVGIGAVSLILGTLLVLSIAGDVADEPLEVLENTYPLIAPAGRSRFTFSLVARQDLDLVQVRFIHAQPVKLDVLGMVDPQWRPEAGDAPEDVLGNSLKLAWFRNKTSDLLIEPEVHETDLVVEGNRYTTEIVDYSDVMDYLSGRNSSLGLPMTFIGMINETGGSHYLEGYTDFTRPAFAEGVIAYTLNPYVNLEILSIAHNENEMRFVPEDQAWEEAGRVPLSGAPRGFLEFESVKKDDTMTVIYTVESLPKPTGLDVSMVQVIKIYADGEPFGEPIVNLVEQGSS